MGIDIVESTKFLGVHLDQELNWKKQCSVVYNKLLVNKHLLTMVQNILNRDCLKKVYYAHVHSHIVYRLSIWGSMSSQKDIDDIYKLQKPV